MRLLHKKTFKETKIFQALILSLKKSLKGEEKLWKVFWLWGVTLYISSFVVGWVVVASIYTFNIGQDFNLLTYIVTKAISLLLTILGAIMILIYPVVLLISIYKCRFNTEIYSILIQRIAQYLFVFFIPIHCVYVLFVGAGTLIFFELFISNKF